RDPVPKDDAIDGRRGALADVAFAHVRGHTRGVSLQRIAEAAAATRLHQKHVARLERKSTNLAGQRRGLNAPAVSPHPEAIGRAAFAPAHAERRQYRLLGEHRELRAGGLDSHLARQSEPAAPAPRTA